MESRLRFWYGDLRPLGSVVTIRCTESACIQVKAGIGMAAGATGAFVGTPAEVALIRMTSDGNLPADQRRNYKSVFDALGR